MNQPATPGGERSRRSSATTRRNGRKNFGSNVTRSVPANPLGTPQDNTVMETSNSNMNLNSSISSSINSSSHHRSRKRWSLRRNSRRLSKSQEGGDGPLTASVTAVNNGNGHLDHTNHSRHGNRRNGHVPTPFPRRRSSSGTFNLAMPHNRRRLSSDSSNGLLPGSSSRRNTLPPQLLPGQSHTSIPSSSTSSSRRQPQSQQPQADEDEALIMQKILAARQEMYTPDQPSQNNNAAAPPTAGSTLSEEHDPILMKILAERDNININNNNSETFLATDHGHSNHNRQSRRGMFDQNPSSAPASGDMDEDAILRKIIAERSQPENENQANHINNTSSEEGVVAAATSPSRVITPRIPRQSLARLDEDVVKEELRAAGSSLQNNRSINSANQTRRCSSNDLDQLPGAYAVAPTSTNNLRNTNHSYSSNESRVPNTSLRHTTSHSYSSGSNATGSQDDYDDGYYYHDQDPRRHHQQQDQGYMEQQQQYHDDEARMWEQDQIVNQDFSSSQVLATLSSQRRFSSQQVDVESNHFSMPSIIMEDDDVPEQYRRRRHSSAGGPPPGQAIGVPTNVSVDEGNRTTGTSTSDDDDDDDSAQREPHQQPSTPQQFEYTRRTSMKAHKTNKLLSNWLLCIIGIGIAALISVPVIIVKMKNISNKDNNNTNDSSEAEAIDNVKQSASFHHLSPGSNVNTFNNTILQELIPPNPNISFDTADEALDFFQSYLLDTTLDEIRNVPSSPQAAAYQWLSDDPQLTTYPIWRIQQRFALMTLYLSFPYLTSLADEAAINDGYISDRFPETGNATTTTTTTNIENLAYYHEIPECEWTWGTLSYDVVISYCDEFSGAYSEIVLDGTEMIQGGVLPAELVMIPSLRRVVVRGVSHEDGPMPLTDFVPPELMYLPVLEELTLATLQLQGSVPTELGLLSSLEKLELSQMQLTGTIPTELEQLTLLESLSLSGNELTGTLPNVQPSLAFLYLSSNQISGTLPLSWTILDRAYAIDVQDNQITGALPPEWGEITSVVELRLSYNFLTGTIPQEWVDGMSALTVLGLEGMNITGAIPDEYCASRYGHLYTVDVQVSDCSIIQCCPEVAQSEAIDYP